MSTWVSKLSTLSYGLIVNEPVNDYDGTVVVAIVFLVWIKSLKFKFDCVSKMDYLIVDRLWIIDIFINPVTTIRFK